MEFEEDDFPDEDPYPETADPDDEPAWDEYDGEPVTESE
jgi:hypothetical protein